MFKVFKNEVYSYLQTTHTDPHVYMYIDPYVGVVYVRNKGILGLDLGSHL